jgi:fructose-1,6-bisphosphatase
MNEKLDLNKIPLHATTAEEARAEVLDAARQNQYTEVLEGIRPLEHTADFTLFLTMYMQKFDVSAREVVQDVINAGGANDPEIYKILLDTITRLNSVGMLE